MTYAQPLDAMMGEVVKALLGKPNDHLSKPREGELRFGSRGAMQVNIRDGWFHDWESGVKGGVLELVKHKCGIADDAGAFKWLEEKRIKERDTLEKNFFDYRSETGEVLFRVERIQRGTRKDFKQHGPDGRGGFHAATGCMRGVRRVLYRLPELLAADPSLPVFLCEGEKNADRVANAGLISTTNAGGAGSFEPHYVQALADRRVVILEDNDQAGRDRTAKIMPMLKGVAKTVAVLQLGGADKDDVCDWLDRGNTPFDLERKAEEALEKPASLPAQDEKEGLIRATPYQWCNPETIPLRPWILGRWLLRRIAATTVAPGGVGKTTFIAGTALSLVTGRDLLGKTVWDGPQRVWLWNLEDGLDDMQRSIQAAAIHHGLKREDIEGRLFIDCAMEGAGLCTAIEGPDGFKLLTPVYEQITAEIIARGIDVLVIDPFVSSHAVEENANTLIDKVVKAWGKVCRCGIHRPTNTRPTTTL